MMKPHAAAWNLVEGSLSGRLHSQRIVEAIEIIKQADGRQQFDNLSLVEMQAQLRPELIVHGVRVPGDAFRQAERRLFPLREIGAALKLVQVLDLVLCPSEPS